MAFEQIRQSAKVNDRHQIVVDLPELSSGTVVEITVTPKVALNADSGKNGRLHELMALSEEDRELELAQIAALPDPEDLDEWAEVDVDWEKAS